MERMGMLTVTPRPNTSNIYSITPTLDDMLTLATERNCGRRPAYVRLPRRGQRKGPVQ